MDPHHRLKFSNSINPKRRSTAIGVRKIEVPRPIMQRNGKILVDFSILWRIYRLAASSMTGLTVGGHAESSSILDIALLPVDTLSMLKSKDVSTPPSINAMSLQRVLPQSLLDYLFLQ